MSEHSRREGAPLNDTWNPGWWCPACIRYCVWQEVTYEEVHDPRFGGCGGAVTWKEAPCSVGNGLGI